jgi:type I restriction enzyme S subunit
VSASAYPQYKPSGVESLGDIPNHWDVRRVRSCLHGGHHGIKIGPFGSQLRSDLLSESGYRVYGQENVIERDFDLGKRFVSSELFRELSVYKLEPRDILITMMGTSGRCRMAPDDLESGIMDSHLIRLRFRENIIAHEFVQRVIDEAKYVQYQVTRLGKGSIMHGLNSTVIKQLTLSVPPIAEQRAIAHFLDRETARLDTLVGKKHELIEKLKEKRIALISHSVTRGLPADAAKKAGLNPHPKLKPTGIDWLGDIPEHWELVQLRRRLTLQRGVDITKVEQNEGNVPVVSSGGISSYHDHALVRGPGVIVGRKGTAGAVYYIEEDFWPHDTTLYVKEYRASNPRYVYYKLLSMNLQSYDTGSANPTVNRNIVHPEIVSWPSPTEQHALVDYLDRETAKLDRMIEKVEAAIEKLQEYRTALITAAVTGKIDVRGEANSVGSTAALAAGTLPA